MAYKRWYDFDVRMSATIRTVEMMDRTTQQYLAEKLLEVSEELLHNLGGEKYLAAMDDKRKDGLDKSRNKNRWYDRIEALHQAFNNLYVLPNSDRQELASRMTTPIKIVEAYERHCRAQKHEPDLKEVEKIFRTTLSEGPDAARKLYALYLYDYGTQKQSNGRPKMRRQKPDDEPKGMFTTLLENIQSVVKIP